MNFSKNGNDNIWYFSLDHGQLCQVIETQTLWGETTCRVWLPDRDSVVRVPTSRLAPLESLGTGTADSIVYIASAARVADALTQDVLLAPIESSVIPLPHQIKALSRAITGDRVRYLLADEVGLGKNRIGLPQVRDHRLNLLRQEERSWNEELERKVQVYPEMVPLLVLRVEGGAHE